MNEELLADLQWAEYALEHLKPQTPVYRFDDKQKNRFYFWLDESGEVKTGIGITSLLGMVMPTSPQLVEWKLKNKNWEDDLEDSSSYGTAMHVLFKEWLTKRHMTKEQMELAQSFADNKDVPAKDLLSLIKFVEDYHIDPMVMEGQLLSPEVDGDHYCLTLDLLASCEVRETVVVKVEEGIYQRGPNKGQPKIVEKKEERTLPLIMLCDFKSNFFLKDRKSFYDSHKFQLIAAKKAVESQFGIKVDMICNFAPNAWKKEPSYSLRVWDITSEDEAEFDAYIHLAKIKGLFSPKGMKFVPPVFDERTTSQDFRMLSYVEYAKEYLLPKSIGQTEIQIPDDSIMQAMGYTLPEKSDDILPESALAKIDEANPQFELIPVGNGKYAVLNPVKTKKPRGKDKKPRKKRTKKA